MRWLISLLLLGCTSEPLLGMPLEFYNQSANLVVDPAFPPEERAEIDSGFAEWQFATGGSFEYAARRSPDSKPWVILRGSGPFLGQTDTWKRTIVINSDGITPPDGQPFRVETFHHIILHEFGHAAGVVANTPDAADSGGHIPGTVMDAHKVVGCIDSGGLDAVCDLRGCAMRRPTCPE